MSKQVAPAVSAYFSKKVPPYINAMAAAINYDLTKGTAWAEIPANGLEHFTADDYASYANDLKNPKRAVPVFNGIYNPFAKWVRSNIPSEIYVDEDGYVSDDEDELGSYWAVNAKNIASILWGKEVSQQLYK